MSGSRQELQALLAAHYHANGWKAVVAADGTVRAAGVGGVTWIGLAVTADDLTEDGFEARLLTLASERMPRGELCPLELLPTTACVADLRSVLERLRLRDRGNVEVYSTAA